MHFQMKLTLFLAFISICQVSIQNARCNDLKKAVLIKKNGEQLVSEEVLMGFMPQCENETRKDEMEERMKQLETEVFILKRAISSKQPMESESKATLNANNWVAVFLNSASGSDASQMQSLVFGISKFKIIHLRFADSRRFSRSNAKR